MTTMTAAPTEHVNGAVGTPAARLSPDEQASMREADLTPQPDTEIRGICFAPIEGLKIVQSGKTDFFHHGWYVVDEPCAGMERPTNHEGHPKPPEQRVGARIPGEVMPGEVPVDIASVSLVPPDISKLNLSEAERSCDDLRHIVRGGPNMASR
jgi:hypothetical protein